MAGTRDRQRGLLVSGGVDGGAPAEPLPVWLSEAQALERRYLALALLDTSVLADHPLLEGAIAWGAGPRILDAIRADHDRCGAASYYRVAVSLRAWGVPDADQRLLEVIEDGMCLGSYHGSHQVRIADVAVRLSELHDRRRRRLALLHELADLEGSL